MSNCHHCWRRCLGALISVHSKPALLRRTYVSLHNTQQQPYHHRRTPDDAASLEIHRPKLGSVERARVQHRNVLSRITDPVKLALSVKNELRYGDFRRALELTRDASKGINATVSYNHIIEHQLRMGGVNEACRTYNEMKKRRLSPDPHTYTIILNGLAEQQHHRFPRALERALTIYNSMSSPKSTVRPTIIHTNAVLKVCSRAGDLDSVWGIVAKLPQTGLNSPDISTYTTLLNAVQELEGDVEDGRRIWVGIMSKWKKGMLQIDEELACAMGRMLLQKGEKEEDFQEVFEIVEKVFGIPRLDGKVSKQEPPVTPDNIFFQGTNYFLPSSSSKDKRALKRTLSSRDIKPDTPTPTANTLSLILEACTRLSDKPTAIAYWTTLTAPPYYVRPDLENHHEYLRVLRRTRSADEALEVLEKMTVQPTAKTFYLALASCQRAGKRTGAFEAAERMITLMQQRNLRIDVKIWDSFLLSATKNGDAGPMKRALRRVDEGIDVVAMIGALDRAREQEFVERTLILIQSIIGVADRLLLNDVDVVGWGHGERARLKEKRKRLGKLVQKYAGRPNGRVVLGEYEGEEN